MTAYIGTLALAQLAGKSQSALKKAITAIITGRRSTWLGAALVIRSIRGQGGRAGWVHEVKIDSLPPALQARFMILPH